MTTSSNSEQTLRSIDELYDLPYSEMTDEEIESLIEYKAELKAQDDAYQAQIQAVRDSLEASAAIHMEAANKASERLDELCAHAIRRFEDAS